MKEKFVAPLQGTCIVLVTLGVGVELFMGAELGFLLISIGALSFAIATKIHRLEEKTKGDKKNAE